MQSLLGPARIRGSAGHQSGSTDDTVHAAVIRQERDDVLLMWQYGA